MPSVYTHHVSLEDGVATLQAAGQSSVDEIVAAVEAAGFPAKLIAATPASGTPTNDAPGAVDCCSTMATRGGDGAPAVAWTQRNGTAIMAGLLSSSCCLLQLALNGLAMLNVVHVGCAGFNKVLGPWRTEMRTCVISAPTPPVCHSDIFAASLTEATAAVDVD